MTNTSLLKKIEDNTCHVGIIGLGYVGLPLLSSFLSKGYRCTGLDIDQAKITALNEGRTYIKHIDSAVIGGAVREGRMRATSDFSVAAECDVLIITVPTPLSMHREPDLTFIVQVSETITPYLRNGQLIVLESTTFPGTTEEVVIPILEKSGLKVDRDFYVAYSPERADPGNPTYHTRNTPKIIGSTSAEGLEVAERLYNTIVKETVAVNSIKVAESSKLLENIFRAVNIALVNELKTTFMKMGIDIWEVISAASTKPFGFMPFYPGPGLGGHCIPIDPFYLTWKAREYGVHTRFIELAGEINSAMPNFVVGRVTEVLNGYGKSVRGARILILGLAYKPNIDDDRESPTYPIMDRLISLGADVNFSDPFISEIGSTRMYAHLAGKKSVEITPDFDLYVVATAHDAYRQLNFKEMGVPVVDTRNVADASIDLVHKA